MFLSKRNGIFYLWYDDEKGKRRKVSTRSTKKSDALQFLKKFSPSNSSPVTISSFASSLLAMLSREYASGTLKIYKKSFQNLLKIAGDIQLRTLTAYHFDKYKSERLKTVKPVTVNIELRTLKAGLGMALKWKMIEANPFARLELARLAEESPTYFRKQDVQNLINAIKETWLKDVVLFAVLTGLRLGEIVNLKWSDIDFDLGLIHVQSKSNFKTKMGKRRTIPMSDLVRSLLVSRQENRQCEFVFSHQNKKLLDNWITRRVKKSVRKLGLEDRLHFHSLRHSTGSWLARDGISIYQICKILGHSSVATTEKYYAHLEPSELKYALSKLTLQSN